MARDTLDHAHAEVLAFLRTSGTTSPIAGVTAVYGFHPAPGSVEAPICLVVTPAAVDPEEWTFSVAVLVDISTDAEARQTTLRRVMTDVENALDHRWGPSNWKIERLPQLPTIVAEWLVTTGREDF
jgi:hypothetical protein